MGSDSGLSSRIRLERKPAGCDGLQRPGSSSNQVYKGAVDRENARGEERKMALLAATVFGPIAVVTGQSPLRRFSIGSERSRWNIAQLIATGSPYESERSLSPFKARSFMIAKNTGTSMRT